MKASKAGLLNHDNMVGIPFGIWGCVLVGASVVRIVCGPRAFFTASEFKTPRERRFSIPFGPFLAGTASLTLIVTVTLTKVKFGGFVAYYSRVLKTEVRRPCSRRSAVNQYIWHVS
ncbi:unnamed protein product, partial [Sphacelaria rigidula]